MDRIFEQMTDWLKGFLVDGIMDLLSGMFATVNDKVADITTQVGTTPSAFEPGVFNMIRSISESVVLPIAGLILTFIACYELIQLIIAHNNLANFETWIFFKWIFKTAVAVYLITNCFNITMAVFDVAQHVISNAGGLIAGGTAIDDSALASMRSNLELMDLGPLIGVYFQSLIVQLTIRALGVVIFVIVYGRMIEIYLMVSLAPIPFSTFANREQSQIGQNYFKSLLAVGFQGFLIMICVGIYAVLVQSVAFSSDIVGSLWGVMGYTVLLVFTLFKTGSLSKSIFCAHKIGGTMNASYISVPRDLTKVKSKIIFNLTKRQLICFSIAALVGVPSFFALKALFGNVSAATMGMMIIMMPFFFFAMYERNGQPPEVVLRHIYQTKFKRPKVRPYRTNNYYAALMRQAAAEKEVDAIVRGYQNDVVGDEKLTRTKNTEKPKQGR